MILRSFAKLNLYLEVLNKRNDTYHNIKTIFERISLSDKIILKSRPDKKIKIICNSTDFPPNNSENLCLRSVRLLRDNLNIDRGVDIRIIKRIPVSSGLGGGSSNAASVLMGLNKLWGLNLTQNKLVNFAKRIGCDVPFFIYNCPFAQGEERGDKIKPLKSLNRVRLWHILVVPRIKVSTPLIYKKWDLVRKKVKLTSAKSNVKILLLALQKFDLGLIREALFNSLERITAKLYPEVRRIKEKLKSLNLQSILMSGSGPAIFGIVSSKKEAQSLCRQLKRECQSWQVFVTRTC